MPEPPPSSDRRSPIEGPEDAPKPEGRAQLHRAFSRRCFPCLRAEEPLGPAAARTRLKPSPRPAAGSGGPAGARQGSAAGAGTNTALASGTASAPAAPSPPHHAPPVRPRGAHKGPRRGHPARRPLAYLRPGGLLVAVRRGPHCEEGRRRQRRLSPGSRQRRYERSGGGGGTGPAPRMLRRRGRGRGRGWVWPLSAVRRRGMDRVAVASLPSGRLFHLESWLEEIFINIIQSIRLPGATAVATEPRNPAPNPDAP